MTDYGTIKIPREEFEKHNERRQELGLSWAAYLDSESPDVSNNAEEIAEAIQGEISMANEPGVTVDVEGLNKEIRKLQELVERVPENTAEQLESTYR